MNAAYRILELLIAYVLLLAAFQLDNAALAAAGALGAISWATQGKGGTR